MQWSMANRVASIAATQAHDELGIDPTAVPIDVATAVNRAGVELMYQPLPRLFGAYLADTPRRGILINNRPSRAVRRHTAGHELGHHQLRHGTVYDRTDDPDVDEPVVVRHPMPDSEKVAEAFATWFLMPRRGVLALLAQMRISNPTTAHEVYQLSLRLGTSYSTTARHLPSLRLADSTDASRWVSTAPGSLKRQLAGDALTSTRGVEVWDLALGAHASIRACEGDLLVLPPTWEVIDQDGAADIVEDSRSGRRLLRCRAVEQTAVVRLDTPAGQVAIPIEPRPQGLYIPDTLAACGDQPLERDQ